MWATVSLQYYYYSNLSGYAAPPDASAVHTAASHMLDHKVRYTPWGVINWLDIYTSKLHGSTYWILKLLQLQQVLQMQRFLVDGFVMAYKQTPFTVIQGQNTSHLHINRPILPYKKYLFNNNIYIRDQTPAVSLITAKVA